ncbi:hypothetical protein A9970_19910 [Sphingobacterium sp. UME9]|nr:hypothetical protein [Sphingobacterium sp. UME9]
MPIVNKTAYKTIFHRKVNIAIDKNSFCCHTVIPGLPVLLPPTAIPINLTVHAYLRQNTQHKKAPSVKTNGAHNFLLTTIS